MGQRLGDYQFDVYRLMRDYTNSDWKAYNPMTNVMVITSILCSLLVLDHFCAFSGYIIYRSNSFDTRI